jgi:hypothetical protein
VEEEVASIDVGVQGHEKEVMTIDSRMEGHEEGHVDEDEDEDEAIEPPAFRWRGI